MVPHYLKKSVVMFELFSEGGPWGMSLLTVELICLLFAAWKAPASGRRASAVRAWTLGRDPVGVVGRMPPSPVAGRDTEEGDEVAEVVHGHDGPAAVQAGRTPLRALAIPSAI